MGCQMGSAQEEELSNMNMGKSRTVMESNLMTFKNPQEFNTLRVHSSPLKKNHFFESEHQYLNVSPLSACWGFCLLFDSNWMLKYSLKQTSFPHLCFQSVCCCSLRCECRRQENKMINNCSFHVKYEKLFVLMPSRKTVA